MAIAWAATLPPDVPRDHVLAVWVLVVSAAVVSVVTLRHDLALIVASGSYAVWGDRRSRRNS